MIDTIKKLFGMRKPNPIIHQAKEYNPLDEYCDYAELEELDGKEWPVMGAYPTAAEMRERKRFGAAKVYNQTLAHLMDAIEKDAGDGFSSIRINLKEDIGEAGNWCWSHQTPYPVRCALKKLVDLGYTVNYYIDYRFKDDNDIAEPYPVVYIDWIDRDGDS